MAPAQRGPRPTWAGAVSLRDLPSVDRLLASGAGRQLVDEFGRDWSLQAVRHSLDEARRRVRSGQPAMDEAGLVDLSR